MQPPLGRYQEIADTLARHGLGFLGAQIGVTRWLPARYRTAPGSADEPANTAERVRLVLEDLGPTFIKLGQLLSTRPDLLPPAYISELSKLQDAAPPVPDEQIRETIRQELGADPEDLFASFEWTPMASASIGQVHAATLADGTSVVVKVRRPEVVRQVQEDLEILNNLAARAARAWEPARTYDVPGIAREFSETLRAELDYLREARNAERFAADFADRSDVVIPRVYWETTTSRVLTMERMTGIKVSDREALDAAGIDRREVAVTGADIVLSMIFEHRFFHADLHPGNAFVRPDSVALIDFGMVGEITEELQDGLADVFIAAATRNSDGLASAVINLSVAQGSVDRRALRAAMSSLFGEFSDRTLGEIHFTTLATDLLRVLREHHLQLPQEVSLVVRALLVIEGVGVQLDPTFELNSVLTPFARRLIQRRLSLAAVTKRIGRASIDAGELLLELPTRLRRLLEVMDHNGIEVHLRAAELDPLVGRAERIGNRLVAGIITAALINGLGQVIARDSRLRTWKGALTGTGIATFTTLSGYLLWTARRRR
ncbi:MULTISPECIES: AarF/ABC1/UbiB kinase family protein [unclassified Microbacterium]|uniref:ABC1 kinase family protein n=1 Tax=unclassified Microbacterium TaxID=2609290 RepID=UPI00214BF123|nr:MULTISPECIES: AarF/ABC1/UbiB kinase family protein [unclassified Microbacterium]MCR2785935.1 AarF/ABC1/UbiB kinase family protein [Microbacterium sp. zg.B96]MDL5353171.1 AarF/ABC1/UbiB kinase family protein [Microbacterium sp. zg-YB36]WIM17091.1 AarF/ABC1/UbiB kinase family protein [Microbacterium sp. zg-B96]